MKSLPGSLVRTLIKILTKNLPADCLGNSVSLVAAVFQTLTVVQLSSHCRGDSTIHKKFMRLQENLLPLKNKRGKV